MQAHFDLERELSKELYKEYIDVNIDGKTHCNFHSQIELFFVDQGQVEALVNNQSKLLEQDHMAVALSYDAHLYRSVGKSRSSVLVIPPYMCEEFLAAVQNKRAKNPFICDAETVRKMRSYVEIIKTENCNEVKLRGYLYVILGIVLENIFLEPAQAPVDAELSTKLLLYLSKNFKNEITLDMLSAAFGYSQSYLSRYFRKCFGIGITQYVNILRLRNAMLLMQKGKHTHTYCALESGFNSVRTFYRVFKQEFQCSPREYITEAEE